MQKVQIESFKLIGISVRTENGHNQAAKDIPALWSRFMSENIVAKIPNKIDDTVYAMYTNYEADHTKSYTTILGCKVANLDTIPDGMEGKTVAGGGYVKTSAKGDIMQGLVINKWEEILGMDLNRAYTADFEVYDQKAQNPNNAEVDFLIAVQ